MTNPTGDALAAQAQSIVTDEMVRVAYDAHWHQPLERNAMRAALNAVLPLIGERLALNLEQGAALDTIRYPDSYGDIMDAVATTIRNLTKAKP